MLPNVLQYPIALFGALRAGLTVVNTNPLYTARELEHQLIDSGAKAIVILENFAHTLEDVIEQAPQLEHVIVTGVGDQLGWPKSVDREPGRAPRAQAGAAAASCRARCASTTCSSRASSCRSTPVATDSRRHRVPAIHRRHDRRRQGRDAHASQHGRERAAGGRVDRHRSRGSARTRSSRALPLYHIFALTANWMVFVKFGAHNVLIANPRDFPAFVEGAAKLRFSLHQRREHAVQRAAEHAGFRRARLQRAAHHARRRHGGAALGRGALEEASPATC